MNDPIGLPLNALRALDAVARHGALAPAAAELGVTPGAVSQQIRRAEQRAGQALFERTRAGLLPTPALHAALPQLRAGFAALGAASAALLPAPGTTVLTVALGPVFAARWLVWRLGDFAARHPDTELRLITATGLVDLARPDIDCAIRFGTGDWPGADTLPLGSHAVFPVCAPALAARLKTPADLARVPVIGDEGAMLTWADWLAAAGVPGLALSGPRFSDPVLAFDAAVSGQGVLLALCDMAADALDRGTLVRPFPHTARTRFGYWFTTARDRDLPPRTRNFRDWLLARLQPRPGDATSPLRDHAISLE